MKWLLVLIIIFTFISCNKDSEIVSPVSHDDSPILPLYEGNKWVYKVSHFDHQQNKWNPSGFDSLLIGSDTTLNEDKWYFTNRGIYYANRPDGLWAWDIRYPKTDQNFLIKYPAELNEVYTIRPDNPNAFPIKVISVDTLISLSSGQKYRCYAYLVGAVTHFYKPEVGAVLTEDNQIRVELVSYYLR